jgi:hypothetical protein
MACGLRGAAPRARGKTVTTEEKTAGDADTRAGQGDVADVRAESSNSVNTELRPAVAHTPAKRRRRKRSAGRSRLPKKVLRVTTYERLSEYLAAFAAGHFHLLILRTALGVPGCVRRGALSSPDPRWRRGPGQEPVRPGGVGRQGLLDRGQCHPFRHVREALSAPR